MEVEAAEVSFCRSVILYCLIVGLMLADGDSKALRSLNKNKVYSEDIEKEHCKNHVAKRVHNNVENYKKTHKELNRKLTKPKIDKIANTYATNLQLGAPDPQQIKMNVLGGFFHMMSTDKKHNHRHCPQGPTSWCSHNKAKALGLPTPPHNPTFTPWVGSQIFPIIKRLTDLELLQQCSRMLTQNANESYNAQIWLRAPKTSFQHLPGVETACALATLAYNSGPIGIRRVYAKLGIQWTENAKGAALRATKQRLYHSSKKELGISKWKRKNRRTIDLRKKQRLLAKEGPTYVAGGFTAE